MFLRQHFCEILVIRESMRIQDVFTTRFKDANVFFFICLSLFTNSADIIDAKCNALLKFD